MLKRFALAALVGLACLSSALAATSLRTPTVMQFVVGPVTGNRYVPNATGQVDVDASDVAALTALGFTTVGVAGQGAVLKVTTVYSAAGTALPTCNAGAEGTHAVVSDATSPTYHGTYTSGGAVHSPVYCDGTNWLTD